MGEASNERQVVGLDAGDTQRGWIAFGWTLKTQKVKLVKEETIHWPIGWNAMPPAKPSPPDEPPQDVDGWLSFADELDEITRILLTLIILSILYLFRSEIGGFMKRILGVSNGRQR